MIATEIQENAAAVSDEYLYQAPAHHRTGPRDAWSSTAEGREYLDCMAGIAVNILGHAHPDIVEAITRQARQLIHTSNLFFTEPQTQLAERLVEHSFADKVFFCNSGTEANEAAIKLARRYSIKNFGPERIEILTMLNSFHGRTLASLTATGTTSLTRRVRPYGAWISIRAF